MTYQAQNTAIQAAMELVSETGFEGMAQAIQILFNEAMKIERERHLQAAPYERHLDRQGHANGYKAKTMNTRIGKIELAIPQVRDSSFYPQSLERGLRSERALKLALAKMYVQGVSTRKVAAITEELCGFEVSSSQVSQAAKTLDEALQQWRDRPLGSFKYLFLDARYEKVRQGGCIVDCAVLTAIAVDELGKRHILGVSVALSEHEVHWRSFLQRLMERGLHGVQLIISDAHAGLKAARKAIFPSIPWQRCHTLATKCTSTCA
jgi:putative transposase